MPFTRRFWREVAFDSGEGEGCPADGALATPGQDVAWAASFTEIAVHIDEDVFAILRTNRATQFQVTFDSPDGSAFRFHCYTLPSFEGPLIIQTRGPVGGAIKIMCAPPYFFTAIDKPLRSFFPVALSGCLSSAVMKA
jgi:hypothetical protein